MHLEHSESSQTLKNKFLSLPSKTQRIVHHTKFLKSSRHFKESQVAKQIEQKIKNRYLPVLNSDKTFATQKQEAENDLLASEMVRNNPKLQTLLKKLHANFIHSRIPNFYAFYFFKRLKDLKQQGFEDAINREINWIKQRQCHFQLIDPSIKARQGCLKQLSRSLENLQSNPTEDSVYREFRQQIIHYRRLTTLVIKQIQQWKDYLIELSEIDFEDYPAFVYREQDYFLTLLNDNMFIFNSFLSKYVNFSQKNDPFFLRPYLNRFKQQKFTALFFVSESEKQEYIGLLNYLAEERARYLRKKVVLKAERNKQIQKIYHSKNTLQASQSQVFLSKSQKSSQDRMPYLQLKAEINFVDNGKYESKRFQLEEKQRKLQTMRRIKQMISTSHGVPIVSKNKIDLINQTQSEVSSPMITKTLLESPLRLKHSGTDYEDDFSRMMRKKQVEVLQSAKDMRELKWKMRRPESNYANYGTPVIRMSRSSSFRTIKIKDSLSKERRTLNNKSCLNELESIVSTLQTTAPLELSRFKFNSRMMGEESSHELPRPKSSPKKLKKLQHAPSLIKHNDQVILNLRNRILKEIEHVHSSNQQIQIMKRLQSERVQAILQQKIEKEVLRHVNEQKFKRIQGRQEMAADYHQEQIFGSISRLQNSKKLTHLEHQLKKQFQLRLLREVHSELKRKTQLSDIELYKMQQQDTLTGEAKRIAQKQQREKRFEEIERQERANAMKNLLELQEKRKQQLEKQMQTIIREEKQKLQLFTLATSKELKEQLKEQVKQNMLKQLQYEKDINLQNKLTQEEIRLREERYRQQVRKRLMQQYQIEDIVERQNEREEKERKNKMLEQKFHHFDQILYKNKPEPISQPKEDNLFHNDPIIIQTHHETLSMEEARQKILHHQHIPIRPSQIQKYKQIQQTQRLKMRQEFQVELFSFIKDERLHKPYHEINQKPFIVKDIQSITDNPDFLDKKQQQLKQEINCIRQKEQQISKFQYKQQGQLKSQSQSHLNGLSPIQILQSKPLNSTLLKKINRKETQNSAFQRFSESMTLQEIKNQALSNSDQENQSDEAHDIENKLDEDESKEEYESNRLKLGMTLEEYQMYKKKKRVINQNRKPDQNTFKKQKFIKHKKTLKKVVNQFELVEFKQDSEDSDKKQENKNYVEQIYEKETRSEKEKTGQKKVFVFSNKSEAKPQSRGRSRRSRKSSFQKQTPDNSIGNILLRDIKLQDNRQGVEGEYYESEVMKLTVHSHMNNPGIARNNKFMTSEDQGGFEEGHAFRKRRSERASRPKNEQLVEKKRKEQQDKQSSQGQLQTLIQQQIRAKQESRAKETFVKVRQIKTSKLQEFMKDHFEHMPRLIKRLNLYKRDELVKLLREDHKCFTVLEFIENNVSLGVGIVGLNEKKKGMRSFSIFHIGPYDEIDTFKLLKNFCQYLFKNDPVQEITLSLFYYSDVQDQIQFIKKFETQFAQYGVIFQKNIFDTQFERKLVIRRTLAEKGPEKKENVNCGCFWIKNDLVVSSQFIGLQTGAIASAGHDFGSYGILSMYLAHCMSEQELNNLISKQKKDQKVRHLAKQTLSFQPSKQKICDAQSYKSCTLPNPFEMNMELHKLERPLIKCRSDLQDEAIQCTWSNLNLDLQLNYAFTTHRFKFMHEDDEYQADYLRFVPLKTSKKKTYTIKSKLYSSSITVMPCKNNRYKLFVLSSEEYDNIQKRGDEGEINLDIYIKLFFGNLSVHEIAEPEAIWLPQFKSKREYICRQIIEQFQPKSQSTLKSSMEYYYTNYLENSLIYESCHRDLIITVPFILGVIDSQMQLASEGTCLVVKRFDLRDIVGVQSIAKVIDED